MASISKRPDGKYRARYRDEAGREHARHFGRKTDAQRRLDEQTANLVSGTHVDLRTARTTVAPRDCQSRTCTPCTLDRHSSTPTPTPCMTAS